MSNLTEWENEHGRSTGEKVGDTGTGGGSQATGSGVADPAGEGAAQENGSEDKGTPEFPSHFSAGLRIILTRMYECPEEFNPVTGDRWRTLLEDYSHVLTKEEKDALAHHRNVITRREFDAAVMKRLMQSNEPKPKIPAPHMVAVGGGGALGGGGGFGALGSSTPYRLQGGQDQAMAATQQMYQNQAMSAANNPSQAMYGSIYDRLKDRFERNIQIAMHKGDYIAAEHLRRQFEQEVRVIQSKEAQENQPGMLSRAANLFRI